MRGDVRLLLCCCSAFLPRRKDDDEENQDYYELLGLSKDATYDEIRRAYKRKSLSVHPDKIAQRGGGNMDSVNHDEFQKLKEAHEVLSDSHKREMYDAVGAEAMHYLIEPTNLDPMNVIENLHHSFMCDKCKLFISVLLFYGLVFAQPILICLMVDDKLGSLATWTLVLIPFWIFSIIQLTIVSYRVYRSHRIKQSKEHQFYKYVSLLKCVSIILTVIFLCLRFDNIVDWSYLIILSPLFAFEFLLVIEAIVMLTKSILDIDKMITLPQLERDVLEDGRVYSDLTSEEREDINKSFIIVHPPPTAEDADPNFTSEYDVENTPEYISAQRKQIKALNLFFTIVIHSIFLGLLIPKLDKIRDGWNWWLVFMPIWVGVFLLLVDNLSTICSSGTQVVLIRDDIGKSMNEQHRENDESEENSNKPVESSSSPPASAFNHAREHNQNNNVSNLATTKNVTNNGIEVEHHINNTNNASSKSSATINEKTNKDTFQDDAAEDEEHQFQFDDYPYVEIDDSLNKDAKTEALTTCCPLLFVIIIACLFVGKLQGNVYSSFWVLFPFLFFAGISLCCCCCLIFCTPDKEAMNSLYEVDNNQQQEKDNNLDPEMKSGVPEFDVENGTSSQSNNGFEASNESSFYDEGNNEESNIHDLD